jgi:hypothetical protein
LITASSRRIDTSKLKRGELKWVALSRDFLKPHNKKALFDYGDTIKVTGIGDLSGSYLIADCMAAKYKNKIDILVHHKRSFKHFEIAKIHYEKDITIKIKK